MLPPRPFLDTLVLRVLVLWLFLHGMSAFGSVDSGTPVAQSFVGPPASVPWIVGVIVLALRVEMGRKSELLFLANLGHSFRGMALVIVGECLVLEVGLRVAVA